jgi:uncharacterized protein (DUF1330 family)
MPTLILGNVVAVHDQAGLDEYRRRVASTVESFGGRFFLRGAEIDVLEGDWKPGHVSVLEFPSADHARRWYRSPAYQELVAVRSGVDLELVLFDGEGDPA